VSDADERDDYDDEPARARLADPAIVRRPAKVMLVCGIVQLLATQVFAVMVRKNFAFYKWGDRTVGAFWEDLTGGGQPSFLAAGWLLMTAASVVIVTGARHFVRFRRYGLAFAAAVLTIVSLPWIYMCPIQIPTGVIVIRLLRRPEVRARFVAVAAQSAGKPEPTGGGTQE
jgi:hypothetical protein